MVIGNMVAVSRLHEALPRVGDIIGENDLGHAGPRLFSVLGFSHFDTHVDFAYTN